MDEKQEGMILGELRESKKAILVRLEKIETKVEDLKTAHNKLKWHTGFLISSLVLGAEGAKHWVMNAFK